MKNLCILLLSVLSFTLSGKSVKVPGYYINRETKDTVKAEFEIDLNKDGSVKYADMQWSITCFDPTGAKQTLKPAKILYVVFTYNTKTCKIYSLANTFPIVSNRSEQNFIFMQMTVDGKVKHLIFHGKIEKPIGSDEMAMGDGKSETRDWSIVCGDDKQSVMADDEAHVWNDLAIFLKDCPEMKKKLDAGTYGQQSFAELAKDYNSLCK